MSKQGIDSEKRTALSSTDATDRHVAWVPLPLARQLLRATHDVPRDHYSARFLAALTCWETFAALVVMLAPSGSVRHSEALGGTMGGWMSATRRLLPGEKPGARRSRPKQEQLRSWLMEELGASASEDATVALLTLLPQARNKLSGVHGPVNEAAKQPHASALLLEALAEALDEERLLPRSTELVWVSESATASDGGTQVRGILLRGPERKLVKETAPSGLTPGRAYLASDGWRMVHPWVVVQEEATPPRVLFFAQAQMSKDKQEMRVELLDAFSGERVAAQSLGQLGQAVRAAIAAIAAPAAYAEQPEGGTTDAGGGASRRRLAWVAALVALVAIASATLVLADRQALRVLPAADWKLAFRASAADWAGLCERHASGREPAAAVFACDRAVATASPTEMKGRLVARARLARSMNDRGAAVRVLADPRIGRFDATVEALTDWACNGVDPGRVAGFVGYRILRPTGTGSVHVHTGRPAPQIGFEPTSQPLLGPTCVAVGSPAITSNLTPTTWLHVYGPSLNDRDESGYAAATALGPTDSDAARRCQEQLVAGNLDTAKRYCATAAWSEDDASRRIGIDGTIRVLHASRETARELDWIASATKVEAAEAIRMRVATTCSAVVGDGLRNRSDSERFRLVSWQWDKREGGLNSRPTTAAGDNEKPLIPRGTCVLVDSSGRVGTMSRTRLLHGGRELTGWMDDVVLSP